MSFLEKKMKKRKKITNIIIHNVFTHNPPYMIVQ